MQLPQVFFGATGFFGIFVRPWQLTPHVFFAAQQSTTVALPELRDTNCRLHPEILECSFLFLECMLFLAECPLFSSNMAICNVNQWER